MTSTATEVRIRAEIYERRMAPWRARMSQAFGAMFADFVQRATKRRRKSRGYRRHVRRMKAAARI